MDKDMDRNWDQEFEGKDESELQDGPPDGLTPGQWVHWKIARQKALDAAEARAALAKTAEERAYLPPAGDLAFGFPSRIGGQPEWMNAPPFEPAPPPAEEKPLVIPKGDAAQLLEHQLATCAALVGNLAEYIARSDTNADICTSFMDKMSSMLAASAAIGKVIGRLRGQVAETRHSVVVKRETGGEGVLQT